MDGFLIHLCLQWSEIVQWKVCINSYNITAEASLSLPSRTFLYTYTSYIYIYIYVYTTDGSRNEIYFFFSSSHHCVNTIVAVRNTNSVIISCVGEDVLSGRVVEVLYEKVFRKYIYKCRLEYNENLAEAVSRKCWIKKALMERKNLNALRFGHNFILTWVMVWYHLQLSKSQF